MRSNIRSLGIAHLAIGIFGCELFALMPWKPSHLDEWPLVIFLAIMLSQAYLLGLWMAFSSAALWSRLLGLGVGTVYLEGLSDSVTVHEVLRWAPTTVSLGTAGVLLAARRWGMAIRRVTEPSSRAAPEPWQIKIRGLMIGTLVLALLFADARVMREANPPDLILKVVFGLCNIALSLAAAWAALGLTPPIKRLPVLFLLSPALGTLFWYGLHSPNLEDCLRIVLCLLLQAAVTFGSLLVLRSCGFRLTTPVPHASASP
jgi:hypothetical protein